jgi:DNA-binding NarL/FixJ family response regulator
MTVKANAERASRVLVVARSAERRRALRARLGEEVDSEAEDLSAALRQVQARSVVILEMDGELAEAASKLTEYGAAVVVLSENAEPEWVAHQLAGGAKGVLRRNCDEQQLAAAVRAACAGLTVLEADTLEALLRPPLESIELEPGEEALTPRETEVLRLMTEGLSNREIASVLGISEHTVKFHITSIFGKLGSASRTEAVTEGIRRGLILL